MKGSLFAAAVTAASAATMISGAVVPRQSEPIQERSSASSSIKIPIYTHNKRNYADPEQTIKFAQNQRDYVRMKWGNQSTKNATLTKRQTIGLSDVGQDTFYFGQVSVGTPAQNFNIILDTGSADFWVVDSTCTSSQCTDVNVFNSGSSSTFTASTTAFEIEYGSGAVRGTLATDDVSLAGYTVDAQTFATVTQLATGTLQSPASGIMGMAFQQLATSGATPFWQVLAEQGKLSTNAFSFQLARESGATSSSSVSAGGVFTLGEIDQAQFTGTPNYVSLTDQEGYWTIPLGGYTVNGASTTLSSDNTAAIDTGTSLIIVPSDVASAIYAQIPNSQAYGSSSDGTYAIPCTSDVALSLTFGGTTYSINSADMLNGALDNTGQYCLGGVLGESLGSGAPSYIIGDVFLKNVFSVFRYSPAAVGFASLKGTSSQTAATTTGAVGSVATTSATSSASSNAATQTVAPPILSTSASSTGTATSGSVQGGSGLSAPVAASTNVASTPSLVSSGQDSSGSSSSSSGSVVSPASVLAVSSAILLGFIAVF